MVNSVVLEVLQQRSTFEKLSSSSKDNRYRGQFTKVSGNLFCLSDAKYRLVVFPAPSQSFLIPFQNSKAIGYAQEVDEHVQNSFGTESGVLVYLNG